MIYNNNDKITKDLAIILGGSDIETKNNQKIIESSIDGINEILDEPLNVKCLNV